MSKVTCPECGYEFEVEVRIAAPEPKPRRWLRAMLLLAGLAAIGGCAWWVFVR